MAGTSLSLALMMFPCGLQVTNLRIKASWEDFRNAQFPIAHGEGVADFPSHRQGACAHRLAYRARYPAQGRFRILPGFCEFPVTVFLAFGWAWRDRIQINEGPFAPEAPLETPVTGTLRAHSGGVAALLEAPVPRKG